MLRCDNAEYTIDGCRRLISLSFIIPDINHLMRQWYAFFFGVWQWYISFSFTPESWSVRHRLSSLVESQLVGIGRVSLSFGCFPDDRPGGDVQI